MTHGNLFVNLCETLLTRDVATVNAAFGGRIWHIVPDNVTTLKYGMMGLFDPNLDELDLGAFDMGECNTLDAMKGNPVQALLPASHSF